MDSELHYSKATEADVENLFKLINSAYRGETAKKGWTTEAYILDGGRIDQTALLEMIEDPMHTIMLITRKSNLVGCIDLKKTPEGLYLGMVTVDPECQNLGIGKKLLEMAERFAEDASINRLYMTVIDIRTELIDWYLRKGYQRTSIIQPFPYNDSRFGIPRTPLQFVVLEKFLRSEPNNP